MIEEVIDASSIVQQVHDLNEEAGVLNGIAAIPGKPCHFLLTGKNWPKMFEVSICEAK